MRLYLDDNAAWPLLAQLLRRDGHEVEMPSDVGMVGRPDPAHLTHAIEQNRVCLTQDYDDYLQLHVLITAALGLHPGILVVRKENDPTRDMTPKGIVNAIGKLEAAGVPIADEYIILNQWR